MLERVGLVGSTLLAGCVVVDSPSAQEMSSSGESWSATSSSTLEAPSEASGSTMGSPEPDPVVPPEFPVYWAVQPTSVPPPMDAAGDLRAGAYVLSGVSFGWSPGTFEDREDIYGPLEAAIDETIPDDGQPGLGVIVNNYWQVSWCGADDNDREDFIGSSIAAGLAADELPAAWERAAGEIMLESLGRARALRPNLRWGIAGIPNYDYWPIVSDDPDELAQWRNCNVLDPALEGLWAEVDFAAPIVRFFYTGLEDDTLDRNGLYVRRLVESARLSGKPAIPMLEGRYVRSSKTDDNPYMNLPMLADDVASFVGAARFAGAAGFVYNLDADSCWDFEGQCMAEPPTQLEPVVDEYWFEVFNPAIAELD